NRLSSEPVPAAPSMMVMTVAGTVRSSSPSICNGRDRRRRGGVRVFRPRGSDVSRPRQLRPSFQRIGDLPEPRKGKEVGGNRGRAARPAVTGNGPRRQHERREPTGWVDRRSGRNGGSFREKGLVWSLVPRLDRRRIRRGFVLAGAQLYGSSIIARL